MIKKELSYGSHELQKLDLYMPDEETNCPLYIFFHGGGIEAGSKDMLQYMVDYFVPNGIALALVNYRLYPEAKYPEYICDCADSVKYLYENYKERFSYFALGGSSAGGYLTMMLYFNKEYLKDIPEEYIRGYIFDAGQPTSHFSYLKYDLHIDERTVLIDEAAPLYYLTKEFNGFMPEILITCADRDMVNRAEQLKVLYVAMKHFKYDENKIKYICYENIWHCGYNEDIKYLDECADLIKRSAK